MKYIIILTCIERIACLYHQQAKEENIYVQKAHQSILREKELVDYIVGACCSSCRSACSCCAWAGPPERKQFTYRKMETLGRSITEHHYHCGWYYTRRASLPDAVNFVNAITDISCTLANDYTVSQIQYTVVLAITVQHLPIHCCLYLSALKQD